MARQPTLNWDAPIPTVDEAPTMLLTGSAGADMIAVERIEQIYKHGYDVAHDDYKNNELMYAALASLAPPAQEQADTEKILGLWPWKDNLASLHKIRSKDRIGQLKVAGAFLAAEIDRLLALEQKESKQDHAGDNTTL